jgi:hypothetical protein
MADAMRGATKVSQPNSAWAQTRALALRNHVLLWLPCVTTGDAHDEQAAEPAPATEHHA